MDIARQIALGTLAAGIAACGYPDFTYGNGTSGTSSASGTFIPSETSGASGTGGTSGMNGTGGDDHTCPVAHPGGGTCEYTPGAVCGCSGEDKCSVSVADEASGRSSCTRAGPTKAYEQCGTDSDCVAGTFCEPVTGACATICQNLNDCAPGARCISAQSATGALIPGLKICTAHCEPVSAQPCGPNLTCLYRDALAEFDCISSLRVKEDQSCKSDADCDRGLFCLAPASGGASTCQPWCKPANGTISNACPKAKPRCVGTAVAIEYNDVEYGACLK